MPPDYIIQKSRKGYLYFNGLNIRNPEKLKMKNLEGILGRTNKNCIDFIYRCLSWDPDYRLNAEIGLNHSWINSLHNRN